MLLQITLSLLILSLVVFFVPMRFKWIVTLVIISLGVICGVWEALTVFYSGEDLIYTQGEELIFGMRYAVLDSLSAFFMLILSVATLAVTIYARGYMKFCQSQKTTSQISLHYFCLLVMYLSMMLVLVCRDAFGFLFAWELMTISSFLLVLFDGERREVRRAALNYLILMHIGFVFLLIGFVTLYTQGLPPTFDSLGSYFMHQESALPLFLVFLVGFGMKAGIFPLHIWVPEADSAAPPHVAALMSGITCKMGVYGLLRVVSQMDNQLYTTGLILLIVGVVTGLWGAILATLQHEMKRILAYSSIENIGIIFIALGIGLLGKSQGNNLLALCGVAGALLHVMNHSFFKTLLFLGTGAVQSTYGTTYLDALGGVGRRMPLTAILFLVASLGACALPPFNGFVSEFLIYLGLLNGITAGGSLTIVALFGLIFLALISGVVVIAFTKLYSIAFLGHPREVYPQSVRETSSSMLVGMALPLAGILLVGLLPFLFVGWVFGVAGDLLGVPNSSLLYGTMAGDMLTLNYVLATLVGLVLLLYGVRYWALRHRVETTSPTWMCGFTATTPRMQYSGESFSEGLEGVSGRMTSKTGEMVSLGGEEIFPLRHNFQVKREDKINNLLGAWWIAVMGRINQRFAALRTGKINHYILYALLFLLLIFLLSILNIL